MSEAMYKIKDLSEDEFIFITAFMREITRLKELTPEIVHEFIEKIVVSNPAYIDGVRHQSIDIYYKGVGIIKFFSPEEMEALYQKHINSKREKEKTA